VALSHGEAVHARALEKALYKVIPRYEPLAGLIEIEKNEVEHEVKPGFFGLLKSRPVKVVEVKSISLRGGGGRTLGSLFKHNVFKFDEALSAARKSLGEEHFIVKTYAANRQKIQEFIDSFAP
jgi:hypothetical protein